MDYKEFIAQIINSMAWPIVTLIVAWSLKDKIGELLSRIKKFKYKDTEVELEPIELMAELMTKSNKSITTSIKPVYQKLLPRMMDIAKKSPSSAVMKTFLYVDAASSTAFVKAYPDLDSRKYNSPQKLFGMLHGKVLNDIQFEQITNLLELRNAAAHMLNFTLDNTLIKEYIEIALKMADFLSSYEPTKEKDNL